MTTDYEITKRYQQKQISKGLCVNGCGRPLKTTRHCIECAKNNSFKNNKTRNKRRLALVAQKLCSEGCGRPLILKWTCRECANKINEYSRNCRLKNLEEYKRKQNIRTHIYRFSGLRDKVLERDNKSCQICGYKTIICIHHINENPKDNRMENLIVLCRICHSVVERINRTKPNLKHIFPWLL